MRVRRLNERAWNSETGAPVSDLRGKSLRHRNAASTSTLFAGIVVVAWHQNGLVGIIVRLAVRGSYNVRDGLRESRPAGKSGGVDRANEGAEISAGTGVAVHGRDVWPPRCAIQRTAKQLDHQGQGIPFVTGHWLQTGNRVGVGGRTATRVVGQIWSDRAVLRLRIDDEIPSSRAGRHVEADRRTIQARRTDTNRIGTEEFLMSAMRRNKSIGMREHDSDQACFGNEAAI